MSVEELKEDIELQYGTLGVALKLCLDDRLTTFSQKSDITSALQTMTIIQSELLSYLDYLDNEFINS